MLALADELFVQIWALFRSFYRLTFLETFILFLKLLFYGGGVGLNKHKNGEKRKLETFDWHFKKLETLEMLHN